MDARYKYGGIELSYSIEGEGDTILLLHGWGCDKNIWQATRELWGVEEYTRSIEALVATLGIERPTLIGHSFGGRVAIVYASRNDVCRVVLTDAAGVKPHRSMRYYYKVYSYKLMKRTLPLLIGRNKAHLLLEQRRAKSASSDYNRATPMMRAILSRCVNEDLCHLMPMVKAPVLLFWGDKDTATPLADAHKMQRLMPDAGLVVAQGAGHFAMLEQPTLWQASLKSFLNMLCCRLVKWWRRVQ